MGISIFPELEAAAGGLNFEAIGSINLATGTPSTVSFAAIDSKYRALKIIMTGPAATAGGATLSGGFRIFLRFNADTANNYEAFFRQLSGANWTASSGRAGGFNDAITNFTTAGDEQSFVYYVLDTNKASAKTVTGYGRFGSVSVAELSPAYWRNTATINEVTVSTASGTFLTGTLFLLGSE